MAQAADAEGLAGSALTLSHSNVLTEGTIVSSMFSRLLTLLVVLFSAGRTRAPAGFGEP
jgi:hypothetical protein